VARKFGVRAGMFLAEAMTLCPSLVVQPYRFELIQRISEEVYRMFVEVRTSRRQMVLKGGLESQRLNHMSKYKDIQSSSMLACYTSCIDWPLLVVRLMLTLFTPSRQVTTRIEPLSCDEAYLDLTGVENVEEVVLALREEIERRTGW
jgi:nucleotidyltransferase/DNA polymerase involved in DNA repair